MVRGSWFLRFIGALILIGLLVAGGNAVYQAGFAHGAVAQLAEGATAPVTAFQQYGYPHFGFFPFFGAGIFVRIIVFMFIFFFIMRMIFFGSWALAGGPGRRHMHRGWHRHGWWDGDEEDEEEEKPKRKTSKVRKQ